MISENLFKPVVDNALLNYLEQNRAYLNNFEPADSIDLDDLRAVLNYQKVLERYLESVRNFQVDIPEINTDSVVNDFAQKEYQTYQEAVNSITDRYNLMISQREMEHQQTVEDIEAAKRRSITPLQEKHSQVLQYKDKFSELLHKYGITAGDIELSSDISAKEFETLVDVALEICKDIDIKRFEKWKWLLQFFDQDESDIIAYFAFFVYLVIGYVLFPAIAPILMVMTLIQTHRVHKQIDRLRIVESLMCDVDFEKFINKEDFVTPDMEQEDLDEWYAEAQAELEPPDDKINEMKAKAEDPELLAYIEEKSGDLSKELIELKSQLIIRITEKKEEIESRILELESQIHELGDYMNKSIVLDTEFILGMNDGVQEKVDLGLKNLNFKGEYEQMISRIQLFLFNTIMNVRAGALDVHLYDPESLGKDLPMLYNTNLKKVTHTGYKSFDEVKTEISDILKESLGKLAGKSILEYNKEAEEKGMIQHQYHVFLLLSGLPDKLDEDSAFMKFLEYSCHNGVIIFTVFDKMLPFCEEINEYDYIEPWVTKPDPYLFQKIQDKWIYDLENNKPKALDFYPFMTKYTPPDTWWKGNSTKGVNIRPGLVNGDPGRPDIYTFGDANVHMLMAGATGAGKSVTIDCTLQYMLHEYPPSELQMYYIDMKVVEARKYTKNKICTLPHVKVISGTSDGQYCLSVMDALFEEMLYRCNVLCPKYGVSKVEDLRKKFDDPSRADYNPEVHVPRIVLLIDEFQVMFDSSRIPQKIIDKIIGRLTSMVKLARAAGIHLWFTSQEMSGTLPKNVLDNFSLRLALRCTKDVSTQIIGNDASGTIREKFGWCYTNDTAGQDKTANKMWKVPFAPNNDILKMIDELNDMQVKNNEIHFHSRFYDETEGVPVEKILDAYVGDENLHRQDVMVLGAKTIYDPKSANPVNFKLTRDDKENVYMVASGREDFTDLVNSFLFGMNNKKEKPTILINCQDRDTLNFLELAQYQPEGWESFLDPLTSNTDILDMLQQIVDSREGMDKDTLKPAYVLGVGWEKFEGIGVNENYKLTGRLVEIIRALNQVHIHLVIINKDNTLPKSIINLCNHKICAKVEEKVSTALIGETFPSKFPSPNQDDARFAAYYFNGASQTFKVYAGTYKNKFEERSY